MLRETKEAITWLAFVLAFVPLYFVFFSQYRLVKTTSLASFETKTSATRNETQIAIACTRSCGIGATCAQNDFGLVTECTSCPLGEFARGRQCVASSSLCVNVPWCSTPDAKRVLDVHRALLSTNGTQTRMGVEYSKAFKALRMALGPNAVSETLLFNRMLAQTSSFNPAKWFDDEAGWWSWSLSSYANDVPREWAEYVRAIKQRVCSRTWQADAVHYQCMPPSFR